MTMVTFGGPVEVVYLDEPLDDAAPGPGVTRLAAAVAWRARPPGAPGVPRAGRGPVAWLRGLRHRLWLHFGPLGMDLRVRGTRPRASGGGARLGPEGARATYLDTERRALHVRDAGGLARAYPLPPPGRTLVLLVDEGVADDGARGAARARVTDRTVPAPAAPAPPHALEGLAPRSPGAGSDPAAARRADAPAAAHLDAVHAAWTAALRSDPAVRAFLDADDGR